ncbi:Vesicle trafficking between the ER and Golgi [Yamadazyma tenuis]|uniref:Sec1-like protein n=1 Tax=Candida tenuis (strain ATCC 10573 / BCRC 21748 / CBS 615 / JCM 9827 / NBRC 10315 / NRRL Y-1498 / VKM Y-70) TaxID=590646 RepID=G3B9F2_CANTC|nr:uncharacterized protein CANTEDRAFT_131342 [Yamadazyma tenuis ATCC 10573]XP_006689131.1 Sec1-like protein [Yamadazyma tenuis ATCC 10573]EGV62960.1 hypothetical protein CANTEDRAFT_131342 [Yamadazyma tenuis ATCC 10573]EGV62961.1 Sec1-like protein [Yamadazyma tenuis ATCC 10573]WEJ93100.1 Vesicle trafficking between the ER and Golgi [Yamadazyma tenuis]
MSLQEDNCLRDRQIATLERMLHLNKDGSADLTLAVPSSQGDDLVWKALVLDAKSQSIISSVLRVNDLLRCGITIHSLISSPRSRLADVPVIYFVEPTPANVSAILDDLAADRYDDFYINFTSSLPRALLEDFAKQVSLAGKSTKIRQVYDQYLDYVVTEQSLFSLDFPNTFTRFNHPSTKEDEIHHLAEVLSSGLLSVVLTLGSVPVIRCQRNGPAELVATQLDLKLRDHLANSKSLLSSQSSIHQRSVLVLLDRSVDLSSMFSHSWIYQCMISDVFRLKRNTVRVDGKDYDLDPKDFFWNKNAQLPFPDVVENANVELESYKHDAHELTARTGITSLNDIDDNDHNDTGKIQQAVNALPELTARKATLDMHMDVLASLLKELEAKSLDRFFELEQSYNNPKVQAQFLELLNEPSKKNNIADKLRTFIILYLLVDNLSSSFVDEVKAKFNQLDPNLDLSGLKYIEKFKQISKLSNMASLGEIEAPGELSGGSNSALFNNLSSRLYGLTEGRLTEGLSSLTSGLKKLLPNKKNLAITSIVEAFMDPTNASGASVQITDDYLYLDPKLRGGHSKPPKRQSYKNSIVFVVGGGNYVEYQNLQELAESHQGINDIIYGSSDIVTAQEFLDECTELGRLES